MKPSDVITAFEARAFAKATAQQINKIDSDLLGGSPFTPKGVEMVAALIEQAMDAARKEQHEASWKAAIEAAAGYHDKTAEDLIYLGRVETGANVDGMVVCQRKYADAIRALPCPPLPIEPMVKG